MREGGKGKGGKKSPCLEYSPEALVSEHGQSPGIGSFLRSFQS